MHKRVSRCPECARRRDAPQNQTAPMPGARSRRSGTGPQEDASPQNRGKAASRLIGVEGGQPASCAPKRRTLRRTYHGSLMVAFLTPRACGIWSFPLSQPPGGFQISDESILREQARHVIKNAKLPASAPDRTWDGPGVGAYSVCEKAVTKEELESRFSSRTTATVRDSLERMSKRSSGRLGMVCTKSSVFLPRADPPQPPGA
jgi:hypothetical protein